MARTRKTVDSPKKPATQGDVSTTRGRVQQVREVWRLTRESDPKVIYFVLIPPVVILAVFVVLGIVLGHYVIFPVLGILVAIIAGTSMFGRRATGSIYAQVEGRPGAAAAVLQGMRGDWTVTPAVAFTRNQDLVHRVVGRPGIIFVAEGSSPSQIRALIQDQTRRVRRVIPETPVYDVMVGEAEGQIPIRKLQGHIMKLPRNLNKKQVGVVDARMKAVGGTAAPMPKGPVPTRVPRGRMR